MCKELDRQNHPIVIKCSCGKLELRLMEDGMIQIIKGSLT